MASLSLETKAISPYGETKRSGIGWREGLQAAAYVVLLLWLNAYICREFFRHQTLPMNSMHGFWSAIAKWGGNGWWTPNWWPFWDCGIPFEFTYAPLAPGLTALIAALRSIPQTLAFESLSGILYCIGPVTLFVMAWLITRLPGYSFAASLLYSLTAPSQILVPDGPFAWQHFWDARRFYLMACWDETPHMIAVVLLPIVLLFLILSIRHKSWIYRSGAIVSIAGMVLASAFGPVDTALAALCLLTVFKRENLGRNLALLLTLGVCAYAIGSPFLPPSMVHAMRSSAEHGDAGVWSTRSVTALALVVLGWVVLWRYLKKWTRDWWLQFTVLSLYLVSMPPVLATYLNREFLPQANRYKVEMELAFALVAAFGGRYLMAKLPRGVKAAVVFLLLALCGEQIVSHRVFAKNVLRAGDLTGTIEYRAATWAGQNLPGVRIMMPGSIAQWTNAFTQVQQFTGGSWSMAYNPMQQRAVDAVFTGAADVGRDISGSLAWLKAYGVGAICVPGPQSPEFWKPFANPSRFQGVLPAAWQEQDTTIYRIPQRNVSLAHVIPESALVRRAPRGSADIAPLKPYVAALDDPAMPPADFAWQGRNRIHLQADVRQGQLISVQVSYHPGWHAWIGAQQLDMGRDALGLMWLRVPRTGPCDIEMVYNGGWEIRSFRWVSALTMVLLLALALRHTRM